MQREKDEAVAMEDYARTAELRDQIAGLGQRVDGEAGEPDAKTIPEAGTAGTAGERADELERASGTYRLATSSRS